MLQNLSAALPSFECFDPLLFSSGPSLHVPKAPRSGLRYLAFDGWAGRLRVRQQRLNLRHEGVFEGPLGL